MPSLATENSPTVFFSTTSNRLLILLALVLAGLSGLGYYREQQLTALRCSGWALVGSSSAVNGCAFEEALKQHPASQAPVVAPPQAPPPSATRTIRPTPPRPADKPNEPAAFDKDLEALVNKSLQDVEIAIKAPKELRRGISGEIFAVIKTRDNQDISTVLTGDETSSTQTSRIKVLPVIQLILRGAELEISPADPDWRSLTRLAASTWVWTVKSDRDGPKNLNINVRGRLMMNGEERIIDLGQRAIPMTIVSTAIEIANDKLGLVGNLLDIAGRIWGVFAACATAILVTVMNNFRIFKQKSETPETKPAA